MLSYAGTWIYILRGPHPRYRVGKYNGEIPDLLRLGEQGLKMGLTPRYATLSGSLPAMRPVVVLLNTFEVGGPIMAEIEMAEKAKYGRQRTDFVNAIGGVDNFLYASGYILDLTVSFNLPPLRVMQPVFLEQMPGDIVAGIAGTVGRTENYPPIWQYVEVCW